MQNQANVSVPVSLAKKLGAMALHIEKYIRYRETGLVEAMIFSESEIETLLADPEVALWVQRVNGSRLLPIQ